MVRPLERGSTAPRDLSRRSSLPGEAKAEPGLVASGTFVSDIYEAPHWDGSGGLIPYADVDWDTLLPLEDRLPTEDLKQDVPGVAWDRLQGSGVVVSATAEGDLETTWAAHLGQTPYRSPAMLIRDRVLSGGARDAAVSIVEHLCRPVS